MPETLSIPISQLKLDPVNPRLESLPQSQRDALRALLTLQADKLLNLAEDIIEFGGLNPAERTIVTPDSAEPNQYIVLEGNRRVAALRLLANPTLAEGVVPAPAVTRLKKLHEKFQQDPITDIDVVVFQDPEDAVHWLDLRHRGQLGGRGIVEWGASEVERWEARRGKPSVELQLLDLLVTRQSITDDVRHSISREGLTTFRRLLGTPAVRDKLGLRLNRTEREVQFLFPEEEVLKGLAKIVTDIGTGKISSRTLGTQPERIMYIESLPKSRLPDRATMLAAPQVVQPVPAPPQPSKQPVSTRRRARVRGERTTVFPRTPKLNVAETRLWRIYEELFSLDAERFTNSGAVLFRVFLELSLDRYIDKEKVEVNHKPGRDPTLKQKLEGVANALETAKILTIAQLKPVKRAISDDNLAASVSSFHDYVHNAHWNPKPKDLIVSCDNLLPLFESLWK